MSDFSVNRNTVSNVNLGNNIPQGPNVDPSSNQNPELNDAASLSGKLQQNEANNVKPSREELFQKMQKIASNLQNNGIDNRISNKERLFFLINIDKAVINSIHSEHAPHLAKLQELASECDLAFKKEILDLIEDFDCFKKMGQTYKKATSDSQKAFLDLGVAFLLTANFFKDFKASCNIANLDQNFVLTIQGMLCELMACGENNVEGILAKINQALDGLPDENKTKGAEALKKFKNNIKSIADNKLGTASDIRKIHAEYKHACENLSSVNPETLRLVAPQSKLTTMNGDIPSECGLTSIYSDTETAEKLSEIDRSFYPKLSALKEMSKEFDITLEAKNLRGESLSNLYTRLEQEASSNTFLKQKLDDYSRKAFDEIGKRVVELLMNAGSNHNLACELTKIGEAIGKQLSPEHCKSISRTVSLNIAKMPAINGVKETPNLRALQALMNKVSSNPKLQDHFSQIMQLLSFTGFDVSSFAGLSGIDPKTDPKRAESASVDIILRMVDVLSSAKDGPAFIDGLASTVLPDTESSAAFNAMLDMLSNLGNEELTQKCGKYQNIELIKQAASMDFKPDVLSSFYKEGVPPAPGEVEASPGYYEEYSLQLALNKIINAKPRDIDAKTLNTVLTAACESRKVPHLSVIWNTVLNTAYHAHMAELLEKKQISDVPRNVFSMSLSEAMGKKNDANRQLSSGERALRDFNDSLSDGVKEHMDAQVQGVVREKTQTDDLESITSALNSANDYDTVLSAIRNESFEGKRQHSVDEMRSELFLLDGNYLKKNDYSLKKITSEDELIKHNVTKHKLIDSINVKYKDLSDNFVALMKKSDAPLQNPALLELLDAQSLEPGQLPKGEDVAVTLIALRDNLVDDLSMLSADALRNNGIADPSKLDFSETDFKYGAELNNFIAKKNLMDANGIDPSMLVDPNFTDEKMSAFTGKCEAALAELKNALSSQIMVKPLSQFAKLCVAKYMQIALLRYGESYTQFIAKEEGARYIEKNGDSDEDIKQARILSFTRNMELVKHISTLSLNPVTTDSSMISLEKLVLNDLCQSMGFDAAIEEEMYNQIATPHFDESQKKDIIKALRVHSQTVDLTSFEVGDPRNGRSEFSRELMDLSSYSGSEFNTKLKEFVQKHLTEKTLAKADALLSYINHDDSSDSATSAALKTAFDEDSLANNENLRKVQSGFDADYKHVFETSTEQRNEIGKSQSELITQIDRNLLGDSHIRSLIRLALSYAAAKLGYYSRKSLLDAYQNGELDETLKKRVEDEMTKALNLRGIDSNLAKLIVKARMEQGKVSHAFARGFSFVKQAAFKVLGTISGMIRARLRSKEDTLLRRQLKFDVALASVTEMVKAVGQNNVKYVDEDMQVKLSLNPLGDFDYIFGTSLGKNGIVSLKTSLAIMKKNGLVISRDGAGKIKLDINTATLGNLSAKVGSAAKLGSMDFDGKAGKGKVLNLKFDSDEEASVFITKLFCSKLNAEDVRLAAETSTGSNNHLGGGVSVNVNLSDMVRHQIINSDVKSGSNVNPEKEYAKKHPILNKVLNNLDYGNLNFGFTGYVKKGSMIDNTGRIDQTRTLWTSKAEFSAVQLKAKVKSTEKYVKDAVQTVSSDVQKLDKQIDKKINDKAKKTSETSYEHYHSVHTSDITGMIDSAKDTIVMSKLTSDHLSTLKSHGFINEATAEALEKYVDSDDVVSVSIDMKLKQSVISAYKNDPDGLSKAADDVEKNYEYQCFRIEVSDTKNNSAGFDLLQMASMGYLSYTQEATAKGNMIISLEKAKL